MPDQDSTLAALRFPRLYAAASLKRAGCRPGPPGSSSFPRLYAAASLKPYDELLAEATRLGFSAALCRGLIEAACRRSDRSTPWRRFPRLYAAASLKRQPQRPRPATPARFPRLYAAASLKHGILGHVIQLFCRFPRLYAAASLKHEELGPCGLGLLVFSAALCRGLIEACGAAGWRATRGGVFRGFMPRPH